MWFMFSLIHSDYLIIPAQVGVWPLTDVVVTYSTPGQLFSATRAKKLLSAKEQLPTRHFHRLTIADFNCFG